MAYLNATRTQNVLFARLSDAFDTLVTHYQKRRVYRQTLNGLEALSNRELADLGLHRSELRRVAREAAGF
jgi:uncharacterized protein YjiS (DUF1127 family)